MLVKTLGVKRLIVVINKMDEPSVEWAKERFDECIEKLTPFLKQTGFNFKTEVEFIPISGLKGYNIKDPIPAGMCPWYTGPTLLEYLDTMPSIERKLDAPLVLPISGKYREMGTMITGKLEAGQVRKGQSVLIMPNKHIAEVLAIYMEDTEVKAARSGDNIRLRLKGVEEEEISVGFVACDPIRPVKAATSFQAQIKITQLKNIMAPGYKAVLHIHTCSEEITIASLDGIIDKKTGQRASKKPMFLRTGDMAFVTIECSGTVCMESANDCDPLSRFSLRDEGKTIAVGRVSKVIVTEESTGEPQ